MYLVRTVLSLVSSHCLILHYITAERDMMTAANVDTVFSGTTMVLIVMQGVVRCGVSR